MAASIHSIRSQRIEIAVATEALALTLQPQLSELNRGRLVPVIERVLNEVDTADRHVSFDRVSVDLGVLPMETLAGSAETALYEALHRALRALLADGADADASTAYSRSEERGAVGLLSDYLLSGVLPFWAGSAGVTRSDFSAQDLILRLLASEPARLASLLRRVAGVPHALQRLVLQLDETALAALLRMLEPAHAALILAYMLDLREIHRDQPLVAINEGGFRRLLWLLTFTYLLREPGSQFNRKSFVLALLGGVAERVGIGRDDLILALGRGLRTTARRLPLASSLPAVIAELAQELAGDEAKTDSSRASSRADVRSEMSTQSSALPLPADPAELVTLVRLNGRDRAWLEGFVARLDEPTLEAVLRLLEPTHAAVILGYLAELAALHRSEPVLPVTQRTFERVLWVLTFSYLVRDAGSQFNRRSFLSSLLQGAARAEGIAYASFVMTLARGLDAAAHRLPVDASLPGIVADIVRELGEGRAGDTEASSNPMEMSADVGEPYIRRDALAHFLRRGWWPAGFLLSYGPLSPAELSAELVRMGLPRLRALVFAPSREERTEMLLRLVRALPADAFSALLHRWFPAAADPANPLHAAVEEFGERTADRDIFHARLLAGAIDGVTIDIEALAAPGDAPATAPDNELKQWSAARLASAVAAIVRGDAPHGPGLRTLLQDFVTRHPPEAKAFLQAVFAQPPQGEALLATIPPEEDDHLLALAGSDAAQVFGFLFAALRNLPVADRKPSHIVRRAILQAALRVKPNARSLQDEIRQVLRLLFGSPLPSAVRQHVLGALEKAELLEVLHADLVSAISESEEPPTPALTHDALCSLFLDWLRNPNTDAPFAFDLSFSAFARIFAIYVDDVRRVLAESAGSTSVRERWIGRLPESILVRLVEVVEPRQARKFLQTIERMYDIVLDRQDKEQSTAASRPSLWSALLLYLATTPAAQRSPAHFLASIADSASTDDDLATAARQLREMEFVPTPERQRRHSRDGTSADVQSRPARERLRAPRIKTAFSFGEEEAAGGDPIYIDNAGLVLVGPFLPHFFRSLDMLIEEDRRTQLRDGEPVSRAVHLLQYLADRRCSAPEPLLVLNKILCGVAIETPVLPRIEPTAAERALCDDLLAAVIARWNIIASSSAAALRETFLQREGRLVRKDEAWHLTVNRKTLDVLVDQVPWTISMLYNAWMPHPLHVTW